MTNNLSNWAIYQQDAQGKWFKQSRFQHQVQKVRIRVKGYDRSLGLGEIECTDIEIIRKSYIIANVLSAILLDPTCTRVNFDHPDWTKPLKEKELWSDAWATMTKPGIKREAYRTNHLFDMATAIQWFYLNGNNSLGQTRLIPGIPNRFYFRKRASTKTYRPAKQLQLTLPQVAEASHKEHTS